MTFAAMLRRPGRENGRFASEPVRSDETRRPSVTDRRVQAERPPSPQRPSATAPLPLLITSYALIVAVLLLDWFTPPGISISLLLSVPILLLSLVDDRRQLWTAALVALAGRFVDIVYGPAPDFARSIWLSNRILTTVAVAASVVVATVLQRHRLWNQHARDLAVAARDMNRILMSLLAHDLRTPLVVANDALEYASRATTAGIPLDDDLLTDARRRLQRSLRAVESILAVARSGLSFNDASGENHLAHVDVRDEIARELESFSAEAASSGKPLVAQLDSVAGSTYHVDVLVLRQAVGILIDNAVRHATPGPIRIDAEANEDSLTIRVADAGPGLSARRAVPSSPGSGLGLELCRALVARAGGSLGVERDGVTGCTFALRLPIRRETNEELIA